MNQAVLNTTFVVDKHLLPKFLRWVEADYLAPARQSGIFSQCVAMLVDVDIDPATQSVAVQMQASDGVQAQRWHQAMEPVRNGVLQTWGVLNFTTPMTLLDI